MAGRSEYELVRSALDRLRAPWCSIVGDHDVHEKSSTNYLHFMAPDSYYTFAIEGVRFFALNAFDPPHPASFTLLPEQLAWLEENLSSIGQQGFAVLLLHCYPSDLKQGAERLQALAKSPAVRLVDMGHTHYNEVANDGHTLYTATRSTGQIEEGPVGFSVTNLDGAAVSWKFFPLGELPAAMITSPADERFITAPTADQLIVTNTIRVRAKVWGKVSIRSVTAILDDQRVALRNLPGSAVWEEILDGKSLATGIHRLRVEAQDVEGHLAHDEIRMVFGRSAYKAQVRAERDQDNAIGAWPERGLLGTQLGPNKNGRKW